MTTTPTAGTAGIFLPTPDWECWEYHQGEKVAGVAGLEPVTSAVTGQRSNQLSYTPANGEPQSREAPRESQWPFSHGAKSATA
jgi:hypothetical protein